MTLIEQISKYIADNGLGIEGNTLFVSYLPDEVNNCIVVRDTGGAAPDVYTPQREPTFQIFIKAPDYVTGRNKLDAVRDLLHQKANLELVSGETYFYFILAISDGGHLGKDEAGRDLFSINFRCKIR